MPLSTSLLRAGRRVTPLVSASRPITKQIALWAERMRGAVVDKAPRRNKDGRKTLHATHEHKEDGDKRWKGFWERTEVKDQQARSLEQWKCKVYEFVWAWQFRKHIRKKKIDNESKEERERMIKAMKMNDEKKIDENMKITKEILKKMTENKEAMKKKVDNEAMNKDKEATKKTMASKSKGKKKNKGKGRSKRE